MRKWFGPKTAGHPSIGERCHLCGVPFAEGDYTGLIPTLPADDEEQAKADAGKPYTAEAVEVHKDCLRQAAESYSEYDETAEADSEPEQETTDAD